MPTPVRPNSLAKDRKVNSIDQTPSPPSDLNKDRSLVCKTKLLLKFHTCICTELISLLDFQSLFGQNCLQFPRQFLSMKHLAA